jgi:hypothetical protein
LGEELLQRVFRSSGIAGNARIVRVANNTRVERECPENFNGLSECWAAVVMTTVDPVNQNLVSGLREVLLVDCRVD